MDRERILGCRATCLELLWFIIYNIDEVFTNLGEVADNEVERILLHVSGLASVRGFQNL